MIKQLRLNTLENTKRSYCKLVRAFWANEVDESKARTAAYLLNGVLQYWRLESDLKNEERIERLEEWLDEQQPRKATGRAH